MRKARWALPKVVAGTFGVQTQAQSVWPKRQVRMFPGFAPGGTTGISARLIGRELARARAKIAAEVTRLLSQPDMRGEFVQQGVDPGGSTAEECGAIMRAETVKWEKIVTASGTRVHL